MRRHYSLLALSLALVLTPLAGLSHAEERDESLEQQLAQYFPTLPAEVKEHISRAENCQKYQWTSPPELTKAWKCNKVGFDNSRLEQKHNDKADVVESLRLTRELYFD